MKHLKTANPEVFDELASGQAKQVQKLSEELEKLSNKESAELVQQTMKIKREAEASDKPEGMPAPLTQIESINLDSPSLDDNQPLSRTFKTTKTSQNPTVPFSENLSDSSDSTESDGSQKPIPEHQPTPLQIEKPTGFAPMASKYVQASIANIAKSNPEFAVHHAMFTANINLLDQYNLNIPHM